MRPECPLHYSHVGALRREIEALRRENAHLRGEIAAAKGASSGLSGTAGAVGKSSAGKSSIPVPAARVATTPCPTVPVVPRPKSPKRVVSRAGKVAEIASGAFKERPSGGSRKDGTHGTPGGSSRHSASTTSNNFLPQKHSKIGGSGGSGMFCGTRGLQGAGKIAAGTGESGFYQKNQLAERTTKRAPRGSSDRYHSPLSRRSASTRGIVPGGSSRYRDRTSSRSRSPLSPIRRRQSLASMADEVERRLREASEHFHAGMRALEQATKAFVELRAALCDIDAQKR
jgi:hypothetical protein